MKNILFTYMILLFSISLSQTQENFTKLPCDLSYYSENSRGEGEEKECELRKSIVYGSFESKIKNKLIKDKLSPNAVLEIMNQMYSDIKQSDPKWPQSLQLADDILFYQIKILKNIINSNNLESILNDLNNTHFDGKLCNLKALGDHELAYFLGNNPKDSSQTKFEKKMQSELIFYIDNCSDNTYCAALYDIASSHQFYNNDYNKAIYYYKRLLDSCKPFKYKNVTEFMSSGQDSKKDIIGPKRYEFLIQNCFYSNNLIANTIQRILAIYITLERKSDALELIKKYQNYPCLCWLKEIVSFIKNHSKTDYNEIFNKIDLIKTRAQFKH